MKKGIVTFLAVILMSLLYVHSASAASAALLKFDKTSYTGTVGSTFTVGVVVSPGTDSISSTDAHVTYDSKVLQATTVTAGTYFPSVTNTITAGKVSLYATVNDVTSSKTGEGVIATITFTVLANGSPTLAFYCDSASGTSSKVIKYESSNLNAPNVIVCSSNGTATVTAGTGVSSGTSGTSSTLATPTPISALPSTGIVENLSFFTIMGVALITFGGILKFIL